MILQRSYRQLPDPYFISGTTAFVDRQSDYTSISYINGVLTFDQGCITSISGYTRFNGVNSSSGVKAIAIVQITLNGTTGSTSNFTSAEAKHAGISIYHSDPDNNYILMISAAAGSVGEKDIQLVKQVGGLESVIQLGNCSTPIALNTEYILELDRTGTTVTGRVKTLSGVTIGTVSGTDSSLSTGVTGVHGYACNYKVRGITLQ